MELIGKHRLVPHPDNGPRAVSEVVVSLWSGQLVMLSYTVEAADTLVLPDRGFERADGLWQRTCFELFVKPPRGSAYREFNFASPGAWNAYGFTGWRRGMTPLELPGEPHLVDSRIDDRKQLFPGRYALDVVLGRNLLGPADSRLSLTAILEETDGTRSYWALAHPAGEPDFHHPDCFRLQLPPPPRS